MSQWLRDCEELGLEYAPSYPAIYYHLSLVYALMNLPEKSRRSFVNYINKLVNYTETSLVQHLCNPQYLYNLILFFVPKRLFYVVQPQYSNILANPTQFSYPNERQIIKVSPQLLWHYCHNSPNTEMY